MTVPLEIVLIEDDPNDVELTRLAFAGARLANDMRVLNDGAEALDFFFGDDADADRDHRGAPRVILLDLKLPKVDGLEVLRRLKTDVRTSSIPVVILTSSRQERDVIGSYETGANSYIVKPVDFEQFTDAVRHIGLYWVLFNHPPEDDASATPSPARPTHPVSPAV
jgi:two-component system, response regulator